MASSASGTHRTHAGKDQASFFFPPPQRFWKRPPLLSAVPVELLRRTAFLQFVESHAGEALPYSFSLFSHVLIFAAGEKVSTSPLPLGVLAFFSLS